MSEAELRPLIEAAYQDRQLLQDARYKAAVLSVLEQLDKGQLRVASQRGVGDWETHAWLSNTSIGTCATANVFVFSPPNNPEGDSFEAAVSVCRSR